MTNVVTDVLTSWLFVTHTQPPSPRMMSHMAGSLKRRGSTGRAGIIVTLWRCDRRRRVAR